jgi:tRNA(His) 5'-end guanylyltransferase
MSDDYQEEFNEPDFSIQAYDDGRNKHLTNFKTAIDNYLVAKQDARYHETLEKPTYADLFMNTTGTMDERKNLVLSSDTYKDYLKKRDAAINKLDEAYWALEYEKRQLDTFQSRYALIRKLIEKE